MTATQRLEKRDATKTTIQKRIGELKDIQEGIFNSDLELNYTKIKNHINFNNSYNIFEETNNNESE
jgi:hypothetical protein